MCVPKKGSLRVMTAGSQKKKMRCLYNIPCGDKEGNGRQFDRVERIANRVIGLTFEGRILAVHDDEFKSANRLNEKALAVIQRVPVWMPPRYWNWFAAYLLEAELL